MLPSSSSTTVRYVAAPSTASHSSTGRTPTFDVGVRTVSRGTSASNGDGTGSTVEGADGPAVGSVRSTSVGDSDDVGVGIGPADRSATPLSPVHPTITTSEAATLAVPITCAALLNSIPSGVCDGYCTSGNTSGLCPCTLEPRPNTSGVRAQLINACREASGPTASSVGPNDDAAHDARRLRRRCVDVPLVSSQRRNRPRTHRLPDRRCRRPRRS